VNIYAQPTVGTFATMTGVRNLISNPGLQDWNLSAIKTFPINESNAFEFHAECYDFTNHANWGGANFNPTASTFGEITGKSGLVRTIQVGAKYRF
jgi:predicted porin